MSLGLLQLKSMVLAMSKATSSETSCAFFVEVTRLFLFGGLLDEFSETLERSQFNCPEVICSGGIDGLRIGFIGGTWSSPLGLGVGDRRWDGFRSVFMDGLGILGLIRRRF